MSKALAKRGKQEAMENGPKTNGLLWVAGFAIAGAAIGAVRGASGAKGAAALAGAEQGLGLVTVGGTVVGFMSEGMRNSGLATAGIGLLSIMAVGTYQYLTTPATAAAPATS